MKYALLIYPKPGSHEALGEDEAKSVSAEYWAFRDDPRCLGGAQLQPVETATTVRSGATTMSPSHSGTGTPAATSRSTSPAAAARATRSWSSTSRAAAASTVPSTSRTRAATEPATTSSSPTRST